MTNQLQNELSPYLRQHKNNPVDWHIWDKATLAKAKTRNMPIFISIGYAACHWCHVMAHECFEDETIAKYLNENFISIKIDREERPDIDSFYMNALHATGQQGGWPLSMFADPDGKPIFGGTYFPKHSAYGRPGFLDILHSINKAWRENKKDIKRNSEILWQHLQKLNTINFNKQTNKIDFENFLARLLQMQDKQYGGITGAPKFPNASILDCLYIGFIYYGNEQAKHAFLKTMQFLTIGGIYDHIGGGIARYSVDEKWLVPHFEKMLYDNAHFIRHLNNAYELTKNKLFKIRIEETVGWLQSQMIHNNALCAALDADSEGVEGKYYIWQKSEIEKILKNEADTFAKIYDITTTGNFEGSSILNLLNVPFENCKNFENIANLIERQKTNREKLLSYRQKRIAPLRDDKILTEWNGYMIEALAMNNYINKAAEIFQALCQLNIVENKLIRCRGTKKHVMATAFDRTAIVNAALTLFEKTTKEKYLTFGEQQAEQLYNLHTNEQGVLLQSDKNCDDVPMRLLANSDGPNPCAASQFLRLAMRLYLLNGNMKWYERAKQLVYFQENYFANNLAQANIASFMAAMVWWDNPQLIYLCMADKQTAELWQKYITDNPHPARIVLTYENKKQLPKKLQTQAMDKITKPFALVCNKQQCSAPIFDKDIFRQTIKI